MSESELGLIKPEALKSYIWLECHDGSIQQVEEEVAMFCPMICREILKNGTGSSKSHAISLPERVNPTSLGLILDYCRFHQVSGRSNKERKSFDEKFVRIETERLCELTSAADSLQLKPLVDLTSRALARIIEGKTPEEIREIFHLPDDLTEEEKLEPLKNLNDDPRIRLLNRLYAKKRKELTERKKPKDAQLEEEKKDDRSVDELLCFINGDGGSGGKTKNKKKNRRRKDPVKIPLQADSDGSVNKDEAVCEAGENGSTNSCQCSKTRHDLDEHFATKLSENGSSNLCAHDDPDDPFATKLDFDDTDIDDGLDPAMKEQLDREVEDFARRLNSVWPKREHLCQERRFDANAIGGNGSLHSYAELGRR